MSKNSSQYQRVAIDIGHQIMRSSIWHEDRCNWLGAEPIRRGDGDGNGFTYVALGPELYSGTSGIALFLAELAAVVNDHAIRMTALGGIRQALVRLDSVPPKARLGLFSGWLGIFLAAVRIGMLLNAPDLVERALTMLSELPREISDQDEFDLMSGKAGAIPALLVLHDLLKSDSYLNLSVELGEQLIASAEKGSEGWSWRSPGFKNDRNLTGLSHGVAGAGYSLLELFTATRETRFMQAARKAFDYEQTWFRPQDKNWPDFRRNLDSPRKGEHKCLSFWCHGAPGIALSRARAFEMLGDDQYKIEAEIASETTAESLRRAVGGSTGNFSLCHGLSGNADVLLHFKPISYKHAVLVECVADYGAERYGFGKEEWPCGTHSGATPSLMLGLAGIGYFYLRLCEEQTPSLLLLNRSEWQCGQVRSTLP